MKCDPIHIRPAVDGDLPQIIELWSEMMSFHEPIHGLWTAADDGVDKMALHVKGLMESEEACVLVAQVNVSLIGFAICMFRKYPPVLKRKSCGFISDLAVTAKHRRGGVGSRLLAACLDWFRSRGTDRVELSVAAGNSIGCNFWRKHGFKEYLHVMWLDV